MCIFHTIRHNIMKPHLPYITIQLVMCVAIYSTNKHPGISTFQYLSSEREGKQINEWKCFRCKHLHRKTSGEIYPISKNKERSRKVEMYSIFKSAGFKIIPTSKTDALSRNRRNPWYSVVSPHCNILSILVHGSLLPSYKIFLQLKPLFFCR